MADMQHNGGIGIKWAKQILATGYQSDNRNPYVTTAKVWNKTNQSFEVVELSSGNTMKFKGSWRTDRELSMKEFNSDKSKP